MEETISFNKEQTKHLRSLLQQCVDTTNPVTLSSLKTIVAKVVGRELGFTEKELGF